MSCAEVQALLSLYLYGELDFASEELIENHLADCSFCQLALGREKEWHATVNLEQRDVSPAWLEQCRATLKQSVAAESKATAPDFVERAVDWWRSLFDFRFTQRSYRMAGVSLLLAIGFGAGRMYNSFALVGTARTNSNAAGFFAPGLTRVREIKPEGNNGVRIVVQRTEVHEISGNRDDASVRQLLLLANKNSVDPGIRMDSVEMLAGQNDSEIRDAIINTIKNDPNSAVRLRAVDALRRLPSNSNTREALEFALAKDKDAGVRAEALNVLAPPSGKYEVTPQLFDMLNDIVRSNSQDDYLRQRSAQILNRQASLYDEVY